MQTRVVILGNALIYLAPPCLIPSVIAFHGQPIIPILPRDVTTAESTTVQQLTTSLTHRVAPLYCARKLQSGIGKTISFTS